jgi:hypothetical protein
MLCTDMTNYKNFGNKLSEESHISYNEECECINLYTDISSASELVMT